MKKVTITVSGVERCINGRLLVSVFSPGKELNITKLSRKDFDNLVESRVDDGYDVTIYSEYL